MIRFILNEEEISCELPPGMVLLDFIRYYKQLKGTKIGCREGDCGACTVLTGELREGKLHYQSVTSCLMPLGNAHGKHIVTIEGINMDGLNPIQEAMSEEGATQCGFCTPGFVMSLAGFCLSKNEATAENAIASIDGNICRCTGYKSIERAAIRLTKVLENKGTIPEQFVADHDILPKYFATIKERLVSFLAKEKHIQPKAVNGNKLVGGGTDLYVQQHETMIHSSIDFLSTNDEMRGIIINNNNCVLGASVTVTDLCESSVINRAFPEFAKYAKLVSSTPIRNMATLAGNFVNASPIGDFTIFFLALDATLVVTDGNTNRELSLRKLYKGYKQLSLKEKEYIEKIYFPLPNENTLFHFEKVSKRTHLDIASVNTAINLEVNGKQILTAGISAGGVGPTPMYLEKTSVYLKDKIISILVIEEALKIAQSEISPISDARGTEEYKRLLLRQLMIAHFMKLFPVVMREFENWKM